MYKQASQLGLRFATTKGALSVEQLWQLSLTELANTIKAVKKQFKVSEDDNDLSFLGTGVQTDPVIQLRFDILKDVYLTKQKEMETLRDEKKRKEHNKEIMEIIVNKQKEGLKDKSIEELEALLK